MIVHYRSSRFFSPSKALIILLALFVFVATYILCTYYQKASKTASPSEAMKKIGWWGRPSFSDDLDRESLIEVINKNNDYLERLPPNRMISYGNKQYSAGHVRESFKHFVSILKESNNNEELNRRLVRDFEIFRSVGHDKKNNVLFTGYYEPVFKGSLEKSDAYRYPIYALPDNLIEIDLSNFRQSLRGKKIIARIDGSSVLPYYDREEIDGNGILKDRGLEIAWLENTVDAFFLQIQGSGIIQMEDGSSINVNYSKSNGRAYRSIGRLLIKEEKVAKEKMSMKAIREYLSSHPEEMERVLFYNESYVFFRTVEKGPIGSTAVTLTAGRSIASDKRLFPKGGLAYIETEVPVTDKKGDVTGWKKISRFVIDQDTGGAIKGAGRVDLFFGTGREAGTQAGSMNRNGKLYYFIKKT